MMGANPSKQQPEQAYYPQAQASVSPQAQAYPQSQPYPQAQAVQQGMQPIAYPQPGLVETRKTVMDKYGRIHERKTMRPGDVLVGETSGAPGVAYAMPTAQAQRPVVIVQHTHGHRHLIDRIFGD